MEMKILKEFSFLIKYNTNNHMDGKRIIGFILLIGAIIAFGNKFIDGLSGKINLGVGFYFLGIFGLILLLGIRRVLRS